MRPPKKVFATNPQTRNVRTFLKVKDARRYFVEHGLRPSLLGKACKKGLMFLDCFWKKDPNHESSIPCVSIDTRTGEEKRYESVNKAWEDIFRRDDAASSDKMSLAIRKEEKVNGIFLVKKLKNNFNNINDPNGSKRIGSKRRAVLKVDKKTGSIFWSYPSCTSAARDIPKEVCVSSVHTMGNHILNTAKKIRGEQSSAYGYKWMFVGDENWEN